MTENGWRGELTVQVPGAEILLRCRMDTLARLLSAHECTTLRQVTKLWDGLSPDVMKTTLKLLAQNPKDAETFFAHVNGLDGLQLLHEKFYRLVSGMTPDEIAEDEEDRKKLQVLLAQKDARQIGMIVAALNLT